MTKPLTNKEIATRINAHLRRFEADPEINVRAAAKYGARGASRFFSAGAYSSGRYVSVTYISYQGANHLSKAEALAYLDWLDSGNVGRHFDQRRSS